MTRNETLKEVQMNQLPLAVKTAIGEVIDEATSNGGSSCRKVILQDRVIKILAVVRSSVNQEIENLAIYINRRA